MKFLFLILFCFLNLFSDSRRFTEDIFLVRVLHINGVWEKGYFAISPEEEILEKNRLQEFFKRKQKLKFYHFNPKVKKENLPHALYNLPFYELNYKSVSRVEILEQDE